MHINFCIAILHVYEFLFSTYFTIFTLSMRVVSVGRRLRIEG